MGWTFGWSNKQALVDELGDSYASAPHKVLKQSLRGNTLWQLVQINPREHDLFESYVTIWCNLLQEMDGKWGYKDMSISSGPYATGCPKSYLEAVTDPDENSQAWVQIRLNPIKIEEGDLFVDGADTYMVLDPHLGIKGSKYNVLAQHATRPNSTFRFDKARVLAGLIKGDSA